MDDCMARRLYNRENSGINQDQEVLEHGVSVDMRTMKCDQENDSHNILWARESIPTVILAFSGVEWPGVNVNDRVDLCQTGRASEKHFSPGVKENEWPKVKPPKS